MLAKRRPVRTSVAFNGTNERMDYTQSAGNRRTFTLSLWAKYSTITTDRYISSVGLDSIVLDDATPDRLQFTVLSTLFEQVAIPSTGVWNHLVFRCDTTQGTASNRLRIYVNGSLGTPTLTNDPSQNDQTSHNNSNAYYIGYASAPNAYYAGDMADIVYCDGQSYAPTEFAHTVNSVWTPKIPNVSFGTNGFWLRFLDRNNLGHDYSGTGNNFSLTNMDSSNWSNSDFPP